MKTDVASPWPCFTPTSKGMSMEESDDLMRCLTLWIRKQLGSEYLNSSSMNKPKAKSILI